MYFMAASDEKLQMKLRTWGTILTSRKKKKQQIKFWDVMKNMDLKGAFLLYKTSKETEY